MWIIVFYLLGLFNPVFTSKPKLIEMKPEFDLMEDTNLFPLQCYLQSGSKPVFFEWFKNGQKILNSSKIKMENFDSFSRLSFSDLHRRDSGVYICGVKNAFGNDSTSTIINIKGFSFLYF